MIILKAAVRLMPTEPAFVLIKYTCKQSAFATDMTARAFEQAECSTSNWEVMCTSQQNSAQVSNTVHKHRTQPGVAKCVMLRSLPNIANTDLGDAHMSHVVPTQEPLILYTRLVSSAMKSMEAKLAVISQLPLIR